MADSPITKEIIERLLSGVDTTDVPIGDVSDEQLYGRKFRLRLNGQWKESASEVGCDHEVYQSILWWTLAYIPIVPLKSFYVMPYREWKEDYPDMDVYRCLPAPTLTTQIVIHYLIGLIVIGVSALLILTLVPKLRLVTPIPEAPLRRVPEHDALQVCSDSGSKLFRDAYRFVGISPSVAASSARLFAKVCNASAR